MLNRLLKFLLKGCKTLGYHTCFSLELKDATAEQEAQIIGRLKEMDIVGYALDEHLDCQDAVKWYEWERDMKSLSREFPSIHFILHGEGENNTDIWEEHYVDGKKQRCVAEIVFPSFDPDKLIE